MGWASRIALCLIIPSVAWPQSCPQRLAEIVHSTIDQVAENHPEDSATAREILIRLDKEIAKRVARLCPDHETCDLEELADTVYQVSQELLDENPQSRSYWRGRAIFAGALLTYIGANAWVTTHAHPITAASVSALLTVLGVMALTDSGAALIEPLSALLRRLSYAADSKQAAPRGPEQNRHARVYRKTQELVTAVEEEGRATDRHAIFQIALAQLACVRQLGESREQFLERAAFVFAKVLSDLVPNYLELDFSEPTYSMWARVLFSQWHLPKSRREEFRQRVQAIIVDYFDPRVNPGDHRWESYERVIRAWTSPLTPLSTD